MNNIESIKEDYVIGDPIRIVCSLGIKEGYIVDFKDSRIKIRPFEEGRKPISISEDSIKDFEEATPPQKSSFGNELGSFNTPELVNSTSVEKEDILPNAPSISLSENKGNKEDSKQKSPDQTGEVIKQTQENNQLSKVPDSISNEEPTGSSNSFLSQKDEEKRLLKEAKQKSKKNFNGGTANSLGDLASLLGVEDTITKIREEEINDVVREMGEIQSIGPQFGFIRDFKTNAKLWFAVSELIEDDKTSYTRGEYVVYTRSKNYAGETALCIHRPMTIKNLLIVVDNLAKNGKRMDANEVLIHIFSSHPNCQAAIEKQKEINRSHQFSTYKTAYSTGETSLYVKAKKYSDSKNFDKAIEYYKKAIDANQKIESAIKDLGMLYIQLAKKTQTEMVASKYREEAKRLMENHRTSLDNTAGNLSYLENFYYAIKDFQNFKKIANTLLSNADEELEGPRHVFLLNKLASVLIREKQIDQARALLNKAIDLYPEGTGAMKLLEILDTASPHIDEEIESIISANEIEISSGRISPFIHATLEEYDEYAGVPPKAINKGKFTKDNLEVVRKLIEQFAEKEFAGRSSDRARYLLTEGKLMLELEPENTFRLRSVMARYCNDMAKIHTYSNSTSDVIRFFYSEAFALEEKYSATAPQVAYYLLSIVFDLEKLSKEFSKRPSVDHALGLVLDGVVDMKVWNTIITMFLYNREITANVLGKLYADSKFQNYAINALYEFGEKASVSNQDDFKNAWIRVIDNRKNEYKQITRTIRSFENIDDMETMSISLQNDLGAVIKPWFVKLDVDRLQQVISVVASSILKYHEASGFRAKELNYHEINTLLTDLMQEILDEPTKLSYEAILPLLKEIRNLVDKSFEKFVESSEPSPTVVLLRTESAAIDQIVPLQIEVSIDKDSSPINNVEIKILSANGIEMISSGENNPLHRSIEGGEKYIFKPIVKVSRQVMEQGAASIDVICEYSNGGKVKQNNSTLSLHLYNSTEYESIYNPYASVAESGPLDATSNMFYGHKDYISGIVSAIMDSASKQVIIYGQKRSGKSSVLNRVKQDLETAGAFCVLFSMGKIVRKISEFSFYYKILKTIKDELVLLTMDGKTVPEFSIPTKNEFITEDEENPVETFSKYMQMFKLACRKTSGWENRRLVVMIDEFTYMYGAIKMNSISNTIMQQWKAVTQDPLTQFSAVLVGQDVVPAFKNEPYARNPFGVIEDLRLTYLDPVDAKNLIVNPILNNNESRYVGGAADLIMDYTACNPYYIQIFCASLVDYINEKKYKSITEADVTDVANRLTSGVYALDHAKFENLLNARETEEDAESIEDGSEIDEAIMVYNDDDVETVLRAIAKASENKPFANRSDMKTNLDSDVEDGIIKQLYSRDVIDQKEKYQDEITHKEKYRFLKIKVRLYKEWLLKH